MSGNGLLRGDRLLRHLRDGLRSHGCGGTGCATGCGATGCGGTGCATGCGATGCGGIGCGGIGGATAAAASPGGRRAARAAASAAAAEAGRGRLRPARPAGERVGAILQARLGDRSDSLSLEPRACVAGPNGGQPAGWGAARSRARSPARPSAGSCPPAPVRRPGARERARSGRVQPGARPAQQGRPG